MSKRGEALYGAELYTEAQPLCERAQEIYEAQLELARESEDQALELLQLANLGSLAYFLGANDALKANYEEILTLVRETGDRPMEAIVSERTIVRQPSSGKIHRNWPCG